LVARLIIEPVIILTEARYIPWSAVKTKIWDYFFRFLSTAQVGSSWFIACLLLFDMGHLLVFTLRSLWMEHYAKITHSQGRPDYARPQALNPGKQEPLWSRRHFIVTFLFTFILVIPLGFLLRTIRYTNPPWHYLVFIIGFPGQLPQYILLSYSAGAYLPSILPYLVPVPSTAGFITSSMVWGRVVGSYIISIALLTVLATIWGTGIIDPFQGGWEWKYFWFEVWDEVSYVLIAPAWIGIFAYYSFHRTKPSLLKWFIPFKYFTPRHSYAVYVLQPAVVSIFVAGMDGIEPWAEWDRCVVKGLVATAFTATVSWGIAKALVKIPAVGAVL
jgi:hypothetical protein